MLYLRAITLPAIPTFTVSAAEDPATGGGDECRTNTFKYPCAKHSLSRKAENAGEIFAKP
ncbi:MAG: hypothetical protein U9O53_05260 [archaeon]|nr:hypothetical protein [archaeon]